jgi:uncharacterized membrane protein
LVGGSNVVGEVRSANQNGSVLVGALNSNSGQQEAVLWNAAGTPVPLPGWRAYGVSGDGRIAVGEGANPPHALRWVVGSGGVESTTDLGTLPGPSGQPLQRSQATAVSADGTTVVGFCYDTLPPAWAFVWRPGLGMVDLKAYVAARGGDVSGWDLYFARAVSANGRVIVGNGLHNGVVRGFVASLPPWCGSADFDDDGDVGTDSDIEAFFACLGGSCCPACGSADFNGDGDVGTDADIESFFRVLAGGAC